MNLAWIVSTAGAPQSRNVHAADRARLEREGFRQHKLQWTDTAGRYHTAAVHAQRSLTMRELRDGADAIFGAGGSGKVILLDADGNELGVDDA